MLVQPLPIWYQSKGPAGCEPRGRAGRDDVVSIGVALTNRLS